MYVTYDYYKNTFGGSAISETEFNSLEREARKRLDGFTFNRIKNDNTLITDDVKECLCVMMEKKQAIDNQTETGTKASETVGNYSVTYVNPTDANTTLSSKLYEVAKLYLWETGLLYRGLD